TDSNSASEKYPHSDSRPMTYPKKRKSSPRGEPSVTYHVQFASGVKNFRWTTGSLVDSWEYRGGRRERSFLVRSFMAPPCIVVFGWSVGEKPKSRDRQDETVPSG